VKWCLCPNAPEHHVQLFRMHLFSASYQCPSTAFTFNLLDLFYVDAMECKTSALNFFNKLQRLTNNAFPSLVPVSHRLL
jgi:CxC2 like cysteine cluster associated with KDZ transposases